MAGIFCPASASEVEQVFALYGKRIQWMDESGIEQWNVADYLSIYPCSYYAGQQSAGNLYVLRENGRVAGAAVLLQQDERWSGKEEIPAYYVHNLVTALDAKGAGKRILCETEKLALEQGKDCVRLDCDVTNEALNQYYESLGFEKMGRCEEGGYVGYLREKKLKRQV